MRLLCCSGELSRREVRGFGAFRSLELLGEDWIKKWNVKREEGLYVVARLTAPVNGRSGDLSDALQELHLFVHASYRQHASP